MERKKEQQFGTASVAILVLGVKSELLGPTEVCGTDSYGRKVKAAVSSMDLVEVIGARQRKWVVLIGYGTWGGNGRLVHLRVDSVVVPPDSAAFDLVGCEKQVVENPNLGDPGMGA